MMMIRDLGATAWRARHLCVGGGGVMTDGEHLCAERTHACTNKGLTSCLLSSASFSFELVPVMNGNLYTGTASYIHSWAN